MDVVEGSGRDKASAAGRFYVIAVDDELSDTIFNYYYLLHGRAGNAGLDDIMRKHDLGHERKRAPKKGFAPLLSLVASVRDPNRPTFTYRLSVPLSPLHAHTHSTYRTPDPLRRVYPGTYPHFLRRIPRRRSPSPFCTPEPEPELLRT